MLFHISDKRYLTELIPHIPRTAGEELTEDTTTPRICFSPTINGCLRGVCEDICNTFSLNQYDSTKYINNFEEAGSLSVMIDGSDPGAAMLGMLKQSMKEFTTKYPLYHAYIPTNLQYHDIYVPTQNEVYDQPYTQEVWVTDPCKVVKAFSFIVIGAFVTDTVTFPNPNNGKMVTLDIKDYMIQIIPDNIVDLYMSCDELNRKTQIELWKLQNGISKKE